MKKKSLVHDQLGIPKQKNKKIKKLIKLGVFILKENYQ